MGLAQEFKEFAVKGNVVDMAVGLIIGAEFGKIVNSLVNDVIMPPIGLLIGNVDFKNLFIVLKEGMAQPAPYPSLEVAKAAGAVTVNVGLFITTVITFTIVAFAVFMVIRAMNKLRPMPAATKPVAMLALIFVSVLSLGSLQARAQSSEPQGWQNESQAAVVQTTGNSETDSYSVKQQSALTRDKNTYKVNASYLKTSAENATTGADEETALRWDAGTRYECAIDEKWSGFAGYLVESDRYAGFMQRHNSDLGAKYLIEKTEKYDLLSEAGYRYVHQNNVATAAQPNLSDLNTHYSSIRLYLEGVYRFNETNSGKLWIEHLPNLDNSADYQTNFEASVSSALSTMFSLKVAYLYKRDAEPVAGAEDVDTTFTTALVAKF